MLCYIFIHVPIFMYSDCIVNTSFIRSVMLYYMYLFLYLQIVVLFHLFILHSALYTTIYTRILIVYSLFDIINICTSLYQNTKK